MMMNWYAGWCFILSGFATGAILGPFFHRDDFLGGYGSFRRRILRLGHISLPALGAINVLYSLSATKTWVGAVAFVVGGVTMPAVCFLTCWHGGFRRLFFIPVTALIIAAINTLQMGPP
jgi:hypothetical protein